MKIYSEFMKRQAVNFPPKPTLDHFKLILLQDKVFCQTGLNDFKIIFAR